MIGLGVQQVTDFRRSLVKDSQNSSIATLLNETNSQEKEERRFILQNGGKRKTFPAVSEAILVLRGKIGS